MGGSNYGRCNFRLLGGLLPNDGFVNAAAQRGRRGMPTLCARSSFDFMKLSRVAGDCCGA